MRLFTKLTALLAITVIVGMSVMEGRIDKNTPKTQEAHSWYA